MIKELKFKKHLFNLNNMGYLDYPFERSKTLEVIMDAMGKAGDLSRCFILAMRETLGKFYFASTVHRICRTEYTQELEAAGKHRGMARTGYTMGIAVTLTSVWPDLARMHAESDNWLLAIIPLVSNPISSVYEELMHRRKGIN